jgi:5-methyltetrahydropteroyltriglutamate--homocysteine methyltransferase
VVAIPTEPIGSIPRPGYLMEAWQAFVSGTLSKGQLDSAVADALADTIKEFRATGSPVITDGEQSKASFATYPLLGAANLSPDGVTIPFSDGHTRQLPRLTGGPFRYTIHASSFLRAAKHLTQTPIKQAVISASALSLLYPQNAIPSYSREQFLNDLIAEAEADIRECLDAGAASVQIDFTEGRVYSNCKLPVSMFNWPARETMGESSN